MRGRVWEVDEKRLVGLRLTLHETDRLIGQIAIDQWPVVQPIRTDLLRHTALPAFHDVGFRDATLGKILQGRIDRLVRRIGDAVPFIKSLVGGEASFRAPKVPLAEHARGVPGIGEHLGHGHFPLHEAVHPFTQRYRAVAAADGVTARHQCRPGRRALHFHVEVRKSKTLRRQRIQLRRLGASNNPPAIKAGLAPAKVVHEHEDDVRFVLCASRRTQQTEDQYGRKGLKVRHLEPPNMFLADYTGRVNSRSNRPTPST